MPEKFLVCEECYGEDCPVCNGDGYASYIGILFMRSELAREKGLRLQSQIRIEDLVTQMQMIRVYLDSGLIDMAKAATSVFEREEEVTR